MKKRFRIIKEGYANYAGDMKEIKYYIKEYEYIFWLFWLIPLPIPHWKYIKDGPENNDYSSPLKFDTFEEAELFVKTILERNKPRSTSVTIVEKELSC
jgi:hypothetical protein